MKGMQCTATKNTHTHTNTQHTRTHDHAYARYQLISFNTTKRTNTTIQAQNLFTTNLTTSKLNNTIALSDSNTTNTGMKQPLLMRTRL